MATATAPNPFEMTASNGGGDFDACPAGNYPAVLVAIVDLGTQVDDYQGQRKEVRKAALCWEVPGELRPDGEPFVLAKQFSLSFGLKSNLRKLVEGWFGKTFADGDQFDITRLLGRPCLLNVVAKKTSKGKDVSEIGSVSALPRGLAVPPRKHEPFLHVVGQGPAPDHAWLPFLYGEPMADVIARSTEMASSRGAAGGYEAPAEDDIPY